MPNARLRPRRRSRQFTPLDLPNCQIWLDAAQLGYALQDGDQVATWRNLGLLGTDATQATSTKRPLFKTGAGGPGGGHRCVRFDGVDDFLTFGNVLSGITQWTAFAVHAPSNIVADHRCAFAKASNKNGFCAYDLFHIVTANGLRANFSKAGPTEVNAYATLATAAGTWYVHTGRYNQVNLICHAQGGYEGSTAEMAAPVYLETQPVTVGVLDLVGAVTEFNFLFVGDIAQVLFFDRALTDAEVRRVELWLCSRYGVVPA